ncbi:MAG TPA: NAD(P)-binding domain-containing protein [Candidatus Latescibacteria bacterium]|nr:hypothetical protein [Gemmatimonadaceae bacterium]HJP31650.1 NAD(P)-binding domain-containing protein [Candidatus Latescibacterota bacterium]
MASILSRYARWLHGRWPAGTVERLPEVDERYRSNVPGLYITGDLTGVPLLKFSSDSGARAVTDIVADSSFQPAKGPGLDLVIIGAGVSGMAAALAARDAGLSFEILEGTEPFSTVVNFPKGKQIFAYPRDMVPAGTLQFTEQVKEPLVAELKAQTLGRGIEPRIVRADRVDRCGDGFDIVISEGDNLRAQRVIVGIGRSGNFRTLGVPGEDLGKVSNRLHDPRDYDGQEVLVVGGGASAMEAAIALACAGGHVTLSYRKAEFSRPKPENIERLQQLAPDPMADVSVDTPTSERVTTSAGPFLEEGRKPGTVTMKMASSVQAISDDNVILSDAGGTQMELANEAVLTMVGREPPLDFFRRSGVNIRGEMRSIHWAGLGAFMAFCLFIYNWKSGGPLTQLFKKGEWFPFNIPGLLEGGFAGATSLWGLFAYNLGKPGFYYSMAYCALVVFFGVRRVRRRRTPYVKWQTASLAAFQLVPLFLLPYIVLPWMGNSGCFDAGIGRTFADAFFPEAAYDHGREYWRAFGFVLAWPLFVWNVFTHEPLAAWLVVSLVQSFVVLPLIIFFWGKGAYCGWVCSCGALAETLGDSQRHKMLHGARWNRWNMLGQAILAICIILLLTRVVAWVVPGSDIGQGMQKFHEGLLWGWSIGGVPLNYSYVVDLLLAGVIGYGAYFWFSGRMWCRFACPLAALMHIYARFSRFRILGDKKKCISCNLCTSVCHQGIDIMNFANKGLAMADPQCVRCSACVESCPTGVLQFGQIDRQTGTVIHTDRLTSSLVRAMDGACQGGAAGD